MLLPALPGGSRAIFGIRLFETCHQGPPVLEVAKPFLRPGHGGDAIGGGLASRLLDDRQSRLTHVVALA